MPKKSIECNINNNLCGEALTNALDFISYLKRKGMTADDGARFCYKGQMMCIIIIMKNEKNPNGEWFICDCPIYEHAGYPINENVKLFVQENVQKCRSCGCDHEARGATKIIFGKEYENLCSSEVAFINPDAEALEKIKVLMDLWVYKIDNIVGYNSQDR